MLENVVSDKEKFTDLVILIGLELKLFVALLVELKQ